MYRTKIHEGKNSTKVQRISRRKINIYTKALTFAAGCTCLLCLSIFIDHEFPPMNQVSCIGQLKYLCKTGYNSYFTEIAERPIPVTKLTEHWIHLEVNQFGNHTTYEFWPMQVYKSTCKAHFLPCALWSVSVGAEPQQLQAVREQCCCPLTNWGCSSGQIIVSYFY